MAIAQASACILLALIVARFDAAADYMPAVAVMIAGGLYLLLTLTRRLVGCYESVKSAVVVRCVGLGGRVGDGVGR